MSYTDPYRETPGTTGAVTAQGLGGAPTQNLAPVASGTTPAATTTPPQFNLPSYQTLGDVFNATQSAANAATDATIKSLYNKQGMLTAQNDIGRQQAQEDAARQRERLGLNRALLGDQQANLGKTEADINYNADRQIQNFMGGQAARGATFTEGTRRGIGDFQRQRWRGIENLNLDRAQLARTAKNMGLDEEELGVRLDRALQQMGLDTALQTQDILQAINDAEAGRFNPVTQLLGQVYALSGIRPVAGQTGPTNYPSGGGGGSTRVM